MSSSTVRLRAAQIDVVDTTQAGAIYANRVVANRVVGPSESAPDLSVPRVLEIAGTLTIEGPATLTPFARTVPPITSFGDERDASELLQFINPGRGFGGRTDAKSRVAEKETYGPVNGIVRLNHDAYPDVRVSSAEGETETPVRIVKAIDVDAFGHVERIETVDVRRLYAETAADLEAIRDTFVPNAYPLYNHVPEDQGRALLAWYQQNAAERAQDRARIDGGRFVSIPFGLDDETVLSEPTDDSDLFRGIVLTRSGYAVFVPYASEVGIAWNVRTGRGTSFLVGTNRYAGGCLLPDDRVVLVPYDANTNVRVYDPVANQTVSIAQTSQSTGGYGGALLHPSGYVALVPGTGNRFLFLDVREPETIVPVTWSAWDLEFVDAEKPDNFASWYAGVVMDARARLWLVPYDRGTADALVFPSEPADSNGPILYPGPDVGSIAAFDSIAVESGAASRRRCIDGALAYDGSVILHVVNVPFASRFVRLDVNDLESPTGAAQVPVDNFGIDPTTVHEDDRAHGTFVLPDGRIGTVPNGDVSVRAFDPHDGESATLTSVDPGARYAGAAVLEDGRVLFAPSNRTQIGAFVQPVRPPRDFVYHPLWNRAV